METTTWKLRTMRVQAQAAIDSTSSLRAAAKRLGLHVSTLSRATRDGRLRGPGHPKARRSDPGVDLGSPVTDPAGFAERVRLKYVLSDAEDQLLRIVQAALDVAHNGDVPAAVRLSAMREARGALRDLRLPTEEEGAHGSIATTAGHRHLRPA